jgi:RNA polymerase sigma-70 factor (ECF subfamily)
MAVGEHGSGDGELVLAARRGELGPFDELVRRYQRKATAVAFRLLNNRDDAMEVVQDAFLNAYDRLASLDEPERFGPWLLRIVGNLALNRRRSRSLRKTVSLEGPWQDDEDRGELNRPDPRDQTPLEIASGRELKQLIARAIDELPELQRQALVLFSMQNLPQKQVADMLGCSVEAVKWHVFTARKKLKERFKDYL